MNRIKTIVVLVMLAVVPVTYGLVSAKGEWQQIVIRDADSDVAIELQPESGEPLASFMVFEWESDIPEPESLGIGYEIERGYLENNGRRFEPFDLLVYYPGEAEERSIIYYVGLIAADGSFDGGSEYDGRWFYAMSDADADLREVLELEPSAVESVLLSSAWEEFRTSLILPFAER